MPLLPFSIAYGDHLLRGDAYAPGSPVLVLHGAGGSCRERFARLRGALYERGLPSAAFDLVGHGQTGGSLLGSSLRERTDQAAAVLGRVCREPLTLIGASMGAYTAVRLTALYAVEHLVLLVPAVYTPAAYELPFGPRFSTAIRVAGSWRESDAFGLLARFPGDLLIIAAGEDAVIPPELPLLLQDAAVNARSRRLCVVPDVGHVGLLSDERELAQAVDLIVAMDRADRSPRARVSSDALVDTIASSREARDDRGG